ncbi:kinase A inhibitor [Sporosarcina sp. NCCP-2222]|uniref:5-oxoprolinase subunit PxpB n=1 Tax=Sporosarcina sp. NCCP-2222 TaxID=2935073 RepID=UPI00207D8F06|nr:5-oxoprolinase subunit PxpB [Sporosarcina sp. NCCP-2222]GKV54949.1 kinase A inhibitor [Sporosarcina sp. NCCP-2222]
MEYTLSPLGDQAVVIEVDRDISIEAQDKVLAVSARLEEEAPEWMVEVVPAYTSVTVFYRLGVFVEGNPYAEVCKRIHEILAGVEASRAASPKTVRIPVLYGGEWGPDLEFVAQHNGCTPEEVISIHSSGEYLVHMIGFAPGFPFVGGMSEKIAAPRRKTPRLRIPARTVGIAGKQTGVYPIETPGGWQLIGRTPLELFLPEQDPPSLLAAGDRIEFYPISQMEYEELRGGRP